MDQQGANILLIADRTNEVTLLHDTLRSLGHSVTFYSGFDFPMDEIERIGADLVIADIGKPQIDAVELFKKIKSRWPDLPIVLITGSSDPPYLETTLAQGYISRPYRISQVEGLIQRLIRKSTDGARNQAILIVDDDEAFRTLLIRSLRIHGYPVLGATNGKMALEILDKSDIGVVIADINMPFMNGAELLKHIRENRPSIAVVLITGYYSADDIELQGEARPDGFLMKPFKIQRITEILDKLKP